MPNKDIKKDVDYQGADEDQKKIIDEALDGGDEVVDKDDKKDDSEDKEVKDKKKDEKKDSKKDDEDDDDLSNLDEEIDKITGKDDDKDDDDDDEDDDKKDDKDLKNKKDVIPLWKHQKQVNKLKKDLSDLQEQIKKQGVAKADVGDEFKEEIDSIAEETGLSTKAVEKMLSLGAKIGSAPLLQKIQSFEVVARKAQEAKEDADFDRQFQKDLEEKVVAEHGKERLAKVKEAMRRVAFTDQYSKVPLMVIYNGLDIFRGKKGTGRGTLSEGKKGGRDKNISMDFSKVTEDDITGMDSQTFEAYSKYLKANQPKE